jgi:dolichol-phosphate mannosyltransferase
VNKIVRKVIIIPSYKETLALPKMLAELREYLQETDAILIMDDSPEVIANEIDSLCKLALGKCAAKYHFLNHQGKSGRGSAIRRGIEYSLNVFPNLEFIIECDADGSHRPLDIVRVKEAKSRSHMLVGSRYLPDSKIVGWPISRRIFSKVLNSIIPRLLDIQLHDITNGLRRYSSRAAYEIINQPQKNMGFIYLSEQALIVKQHGLEMAEIPIDFIDRTEGSSTVTWREIAASVQGVVVVVKQKIIG